ncbi:MAG: histidinol dehydrogenase [bacterium]|nr:histidinol dehydrogenase [bacterium]
MSSVNEIISDVKNNGDSAVKKYTEKFDGKVENIEVTKAEIEEALKIVPQEVIEAIKLSIKNVKTFAEAQLNSVKEFEVENCGVKLSQKIVPLERTGAYVPGGNYPLPSSAIMSIVPAKVAGVKEVIMCSPKIQPATIVAGYLAGADRIFRVGGVQAVAAMAYGTQSIPKVDKITGPGNKFVTFAKKQVFGVCGIDFLAGPSEVMVIADESANAKFVAADFLAQCEHDADASGILLTTSENFANEVKTQTEEFLKTLKTADIAKKALEHSYIIIVDNLNEAVEIANKKAPEHLEIMTKENEKLKEKLTCYGSLFIGDYSAEVLGDYCSGTNHILPTNKVARYNGGLSVFDFIKILTCQEAVNADEVTKNASVLADTEGLMAHKLAADVRVK